MLVEGLLTVVFIVAAGLLVLAGVVKLRTPEPTSRALRGAGLPSSHLLVRGLGTLEIAAGAAGLAVPAVGAPAVAVLYAAFGCFVAYVLARGLPLSSCGCLGETETRPSLVHVAVTLCAAAAGLAAALAPPPSLASLAAADPLLTAVLLAGAGTALYLTYATLALLPAALSAYQGAESDHPA